MKSSKKNIIPIKIRLAKKTNLLVKYYQGLEFDPKKPEKLN